LELSGEFGEQVWQLVAEKALQLVAEQALQPGVGQVLVELVLLGRH